MTFMMMGSGTVIGILDLRHSNRTIEEIVGSLMTRVDAARQLEAEQAEFNIVLRDYVFAGNAAERAVLENITGLRGAMSASIAHLNELADEAGQPMIAAHSDQRTAAEALASGAGELSTEVDQLKDAVAFFRSGQVQTGPVATPSPKSRPASRPVLRLVGRGFGLDMSDRRHVG
ncbi:hypothetical protein [Rhodobacter sp. NSM]|uniref:hypothetical protein n=1 Tax=Rhodobacter sp. NSM TaxID=3457501 RepID=UPI003FD44DBD